MSPPSEAIPTDIAWEAPSCPVCGDAAADPVLEAPDRLNRRPGRFRVVRCSTCRLMRTSPRPTPASIGWFYPSTYRAYQTVSEPPPDETRLGLKRRLARWAFDFKNQALPPQPPGRLFEVGTGNGRFLRLMEARGWTVSGLDPSEQAAENARQVGLTVEASPIAAARGPAAPADLVVGWMVLEHLHEPVEDLRRIRTWLRDDGWLVGSVPNAASLDFLVFRDAWYALQVPTHLFHFTPSTLSATLKRAGFRLERLWSHRVLANYFPSLAYRIEDLVGPERLRPVQDWLRGVPTASPRVAMGLYPLAWIAAGLGQTGRMTFWARPEGS